MHEFLLFAAVGFLAQIVDGALGMAYGVVCSTVLLSLGVTPAHVSAAVHVAELFTTAASGTSHLYHRNIDWHLFLRLAPFGIVGGCVGAFVLTSFEGEMVKPFITTYLALIGCWLVVRSFRKIPSKPVPASFVAPLGTVGGFLDAAGGGGWGPVVTTGLLGAGAAPRYVVGTVNASEFLITLTISSTFLAALLTGYWQTANAYSSQALAIAGLVVGGIGAAPFAGLITKRISEGLLLRAIGCLIVLLATWQTIEMLGFI